ncbi:MAG: GGDEF domain-containing protein [Actinobacteria bacterium]|nr:GGDEF domain-containing protein [Actinomycetota bacterium]
MQSPLYQLHRPSSPARREALSWIVAALLYAAAIAWLLPHVADPLRDVPAVPLAHALSLAVVTSLTAVVLWLEARRTQVRGYLVLGGTFSSIAVLLLAFTLAFPGALLPDAPDGTPRSVLGGPNTPVALFLLWHVVITVGIPASAVVLSRDDANGRVPALRHGIVPGVVWGTVPVLLLSTWWLLVPDAAPALFQPPGLSPLGTSVTEATVLLAIAGLIVAVVATRASSVLSRWLLAICVLNLGDALLNLGALRYSLGWYAARALGFLALSALLIVLVVQLARIDRRTDRAATTDALTGLRNRITLDEDLAREMARAERETRRLAVLVIDLDRFKQINDRYGHAMGDVVLREVAARLRAEVRAGDLLVRLGGDEFIVVLVGLDDDDQAAAAAGRIVAELRRPVTHREHHVVSPVSVGVALSHPTAPTPSDLMLQADAAMFAAKQVGGDCYVVHVPATPRP